MNYLAHIYLSEGNKLVTIGNFIADDIKGKKYQTLPKEIQIGILLHRHIDTFTDAHPIVRQSTKKLHKNYGHYSGVIVDILYDHFLAKNWVKYSTTLLPDYIENFYDLLRENFELLPPRIQKMMPHMVTDNWLIYYASIDGITKVLDAMNKRTQNRSGMDRAIDELTLYYDEFENEFTLFFEELRASSKEKFKLLNTIIR
ncbi:acyl carrier protein phosphodiesterase [Neotamlana laminarinivorans]|uniref:Acyl carrier protein phosphodiesterase n=1 Tax=Neotamlana laminarinivorans TaxID=2883124 RepID=A0A9X1HXF2_9FLAO|nr:acyl carrier protein phosphodiesterase [Tamlana laminarinivorans]MCB4797929.1 acyl carrier protein phosphodiesterase [Tamlana laminarinivorans]